LLDSVRKRQQVEHFRSRFADDVRHIHLTVRISAIPDSHFSVMADSVSN